MIKLRWTKYILPTGREVYLTNRPDVIEDKSLNEWMHQEYPIVRFTFTDDYVEPPRYDNGDLVPWHWLPWVPGKNIPMENVFAFISMMERYGRTFDRSYHYNDGPVWLHCDSSTMRAPTYFGLFLHAIYPDKVQEIVDTKQFSKTMHHSCPVSYAQTSFKLDAGIKELIETWSRDGEKAAYKIYMKE